MADKGSRQGVSVLPSGSLDSSEGRTTGDMEANKTKRNNTIISAETCWENDKDGQAVIKEGAVLAGVAGAGSAERGI